MKICCVFDDSQSALGDWARALGAERLTFHELFAHPGAASFDLVLAEASSATLDSIVALGARLAGSGCLLVAHVARSFASDSPELPRWREALSACALVLAPQHEICAELRTQLGVVARPVAPPQAWANRREDVVPSLSGRPCFTVLGPPGYTRLAFLRDVGAAAYFWTELRFRLRICDATRPLDESAEAIHASRFVYLACPLQDGGALTALCASAGSVLLAPLDYSPARVAFPYTIFPSSPGSASRRRRSLLLLWLYTSREFTEFFRETARKRLPLFADENRRVELLRKVQYLAPGLEPVPLPGARASLWEQIRHRSGPRALAGGSESAVLVCLVRNGCEHLPSFLRHYRALGIAEFVFVDNGSDDGTLEMLEAQPDVTLYETSLPHKDYEVHIRRLAIEQHCRGRWCLNVDVDELFDYPHSGELEFAGLLRYLRERGATAMAGHMLDMYDSRRGTSHGPEQDLREAYPDYDVSQLERTSYVAEEHRPYCDANVLLAEIPCFRGGIRQTIFGSKSGARYLLIKHPLLFLDGELEPVTHPHFSNHARVADVTCVLYHYKFTPSFKARALESRASRRYVKFAQAQYDQYLAKLGDRTSLAISTPGTRRLESVDDLLPLGFVHASAEYRSFVASSLRTAQHQMVEPGARAVELEQGPDEATTC